MCISSECFWNKTRNKSQQMRKITCIASAIEKLLIPKSKKSVENKPPSTPPALSIAYALAKVSFSPTNLLAAHWNKSPAKKPIG